MCAPNVIGSYLQVRVAGHVCTVVVQRGWGGGSAKRLGGECKEVGGGECKEVLFALLVH